MWAGNPTMMLVAVVSCPGSTSYTGAGEPLQCCWPKALPILTVGKSLGTRLDKKYQALPILTVG